ncbi:MAG TPA: MFS transporter [Anaerolineae bacterium]|nr:MFS transporter [Anaerolineae bacterium]
MANESIPRKADTRSSRLPRNVWIVTLTSFLTDVSSEMLLSLLPLFLFNVLGITTSLIGLIEGVAETTASLLKVFSGWISDRMGRRKALAVMGYTLSSVVKPFLYVTTTWFGVMAVRFADRVGKGLRTAPRDALVADSVDEHQRGLAFGLHRAGDTAGAMIGIGLALVLILIAGGAERLTRASFQLVVLLSVIPAVAAVLVLALGARETAVAPDEGRAPRLTLAGFDHRFRWFLLILVFFTLGNSSDAFLIIRAQTTGLNVGGVLGMMITFNLTYALVSTPAGLLSDKVGRKRVLIGGWLLYALVYLGFAGAGSGWQAWSLMAVYGVYYGLTEGVAKAFVADLVPVERRGTAFGLFNAAVGVMVFPASLIAGVLWQGVGDWTGFGQSAPFLFGAALSLLATLMLIMLPGERVRIEA